MGKPVQTTKVMRYVFDSAEALSGVWNILDNAGLTLEVHRRRILNGVNAWLKNFVLGRLAYLPELGKEPLDGLVVWCDTVNVAVPRSNDDSPHDLVHYLLDTYFTQELGELIPLGCWNLVTIEINEDGTLFVEVGEDFRIVDWMRQHRPKKTKRKRGYR